MNHIRLIQQTLRRVKDPLIRERLRMVKSSYEQPLRDVAEEFNCVHGRVDYWKKRYEQGGLRGLSTKPRSGRPKKISPAQEQMLRRTVRKHNIKQGWKTKHVRQLITKKTEITYSFRHTIRILHAWGLSKIKTRPRYAFSKQEDRDAFLKKTQPTWRISQKDGLSS